MAFRWRSDDGPLLLVFGSPHQLKNNNKTPSWTPLKKLSGSAHGLATETSENITCLLHICTESLDIILLRERITLALIKLRRLAGCTASFVIYACNKIRIVLLKSHKFAIDTNASVFIFLYESFML